ncbi:RAD51-associated protein 1 isoform X2 [Cetorhinus maximus]
MARPARTKKVVDYSQCEDFDDDEDFACVSAPPSKKSRLMPKDQKQRKEKNIKNSGSQDAKVKKELTKERLPLDEKLYQRNLEAALVLSVQEPTSEALDKISAETEGTSVRPRQRRAAAGATSKQKQILLDEKAEESESSESNTDEDEEFTFKNLSNKNKKRDKSKIQTKKEKKSPKPNNSARVVVPVKSKPLLLEIMPASPPPSKSLQVSSPSTGMRKPKWTPPAPKESSNNSQERTSVRSPCQGLRLGLSRLARVKPLHRSTDND